MKGRKQKYAYFIGVIKKFQGLGFIVNFDNPIIINEYFSIEIRLLWIKIWFTYEFSNKNNSF